MSVHTAPQSAEPARKPLTAMDMVKAKGVRKLSMITAYDYSIAALAEASGMDMILIGDSLGMVMLGYNDTMAVTMDDMIHHSRAVSRAAKASLVVADMPFMSYETGVRDAMRNAARLCQEGGVRAVKLEGGRNIAPQVKALVQSGIPVCGHIGLTPQRAAVLGGFKVQAKSAEAALSLVEDAVALEEAGCFAVVLEAVPAPIAKRVTGLIKIPTIGIGAGPECDGQVLVYHDMLGLYGAFVPKFAKQYAQIGESIKGVFRQYVSEVADGSFPGPEHCFSIKDEELEELDQLMESRFDHLLD